MDLFLTFKMEKEIKIPRYSNLLYFSEKIIIIITKKAISLWKINTSIILMLVRFQ